jgi:hypothetical protein
MVEKENGRSCRIGSVHNQSSNRFEMDSHADTCVGGANSVLLETKGETATVYSFSQERKPFGEIPIGTIAMTWVSSINGESLVLVFPE